MTPDRCCYRPAYLPACHQPRPTGMRFCAEHQGKACASCGAQAVEECDFTGQFVCGAPLCADCEGYEIPGSSGGLWGFMNHRHRKKETPVVENQHRQIQGYRDLTQAEIDLMNEAKALEAQAAALVAKVRFALAELGRAAPQASRDLAMARTAYEDATIRLVRAIAQPVSPWES